MFIPAVKDRRSRKPKDEFKFYYLPQYESVVNP